LPSRKQIQPDYQQGIKKIKLNSGTNISNPFQLNRKKRYWP